MRPRAVGSEEPLVGRDDEQARLDDFVDAAADLPRVSAIVLSGEVGIGKSTLWQYGVDRSRAAGRPVLTSRPAGDDRFAATTLAMIQSRAIEANRDPQRLAALRTDEYRCATK